MALDLISKVFYKQLVQTSDKKTLDPDLKVQWARRAASFSLFYKWPGIVLGPYIEKGFLTLTWNHGYASFLWVSTTPNILGELRASMDGAIAQNGRGNHTKWVGLWFRSGIWGKCLYFKLHKANIKIHNTVLLLFPATNCRKTVECVVSTE